MKSRRPLREPDQSVTTQLQSLAKGLDANSPTPLYQQIAVQIEQWIENGHLSAGERLMSERKLTEFLNVSRRTVRAAFARLIERRYLSATHGRGNFVLEPPVRQEFRYLSLERFAPQHWRVTPYHYDLIHEAEEKTHAFVHYKYTPTAQKLRETLLRPPSGYDGILVIRPEQSWVDMLLSMDKETFPVPVVVVNRNLSGSKLNFVSPHHFQQTYEAAQKLIALGHRRIGYVSGQTSAHFMRLAYDGFLQALTESGFPRHEEDIFLTESLEPGSIERGLKPYLEKRRYSAVVVAGSALSMPFEKTIQASATVIPDQLSAILVTEQYTLDKMAMRWTAHCYPDRAAMLRSLEFLRQYHQRQAFSSIQELLPHTVRMGASCREA